MGRNEQFGAHLGGDERLGTWTGLLGKMGSTKSVEITFEGGTMRQD